MKVQSDFGFMILGILAVLIIIAVGQMDDTNGPFWLRVSISIGQLIVIVLIILIKKMKEKRSM